MLSLRSKSLSQDREELHLVVVECSQALELVPTHAKARFRRATALITLGALEDAQRDIGHLQGPERDSAASMLEASRGHDGIDYLAENNRSLDELLREYDEYDKFDSNAASIFWLANVLVPVDQQEARLRTANLSLEEDDWEELIPVLQAISKGWNEIRRESLGVRLLRSNGGRPWDPQLLELRMRPALLVSAAAACEDTRYRRWKEHYDCERHHVVSGGLTWSNTDPAVSALRPAPAELVISISAGQDDILMVHALLSAHGKRDLVRQIEGMVEENVMHHMGATVLHMMARAGKHAIVEFLLERGAHVDCRDNGKYYGLPATPTDYAVLTLDEVQRERYTMGADQSHIDGVKQSIRHLKVAGGTESDVVQKSRAEAARIQGMFGGMSGGGGMFGDNAFGGF
eukprot:4312652-Prymnesium_polylepis.1